jgi:hypothetical protein
VTDARVVVRQAPLSSQSIAWTELVNCLMRLRIALLPLFMLSAAAGIGFGPYISIDNHGAGTSRNDESQKAVSGIVSLTASYRASRNWAGRLSWNRIATGYNRDTDVIMAGPSYRF